MRFLLQPASHGTVAVRARYERTIKNEVRFADHEDLLSSEDLTRLRGLFPVGVAPLWGLTPGKSGSNRARVEGFYVGDAVFFYSNRRLFSGGTVAYRFQNQDLALRLWGRDGSGLTWEHVYAIADLRQVDIPFREVLAVLGWKNLDSPLQSAYIVSEEKADYLAALWELDVPTVGGAADEAASLAELPAPFEGPTDRLSVRAHRVEQERLKRHLLAVGRSRCALCEREYPSRFLVAAHIKKRAACTSAEKRDLENIGMLACLLGCDSLYEHGYIGIGSDGEILVADDAREVPAFSNYAAAYLRGRACAWWSPNREPYFSWHRTHTFRLFGADYPEH